MLIGIFIPDPQDHCILHFLILEVSPFLSVKV